MSTKVKRMRDDVMSFLLMVSKTDVNALKYCTKETHSVQVSIGIIIMITGVMAFISSYYAFETVFFSDHMSVFSFIGVTIVSLFYAFAIVMFDRLVISLPTSGNPWAKAGAIGMRIVFACFIGIVISFPLELKLQQNQIEYQVQKMVETRNIAKQTEINEITEKVKKAEGEELIPLQEAINIKKKSWENLTQQYNLELNRGGTGPKAEMLYGLSDAAKKDLDTASKNYQLGQKNIQATINERFKNELETRKRLEAEIASDKQSKDFLTQFIALEQVKDEFPGASAFGFFLTAFFIMFEIFPTIIKAMMPYNEYQAYLDARRRINVNKIVGVTNHANKVIEREIKKYEESGDIQSLQHLKKQLGDTEITDIFESLMEDSHDEMYQTKKVDSDTVARA